LRNDLLRPIAQLFKRNCEKNSLLVSSILDLLDLVRREKISELAKEIIEKYRDAFDCAASHALFVELESLHHDSSVLATSNLALVAAHSGEDAGVEIGAAMQHDAAFHGDLDQDDGVPACAALDGVIGCVSSGGEPNIPELILDSALESLTESRAERAGTVEQPLVGSRTVEQGGGVAGDRKGNDEDNVVSEMEPKVSCKNISENATCASTVANSATSKAHDEKLDHGVHGQVVFGFGDAAEQGGDGASLRAEISCSGLGEGESLEKADNLDATDGSHSARQAKRPRVEASHTASETAPTGALPAGDDSRTADKESAHQRLSGAYSLKWEADQFKCEGGVSIMDKDEGVVFSDDSAPADCAHLSAKPSASNAANVLRTETNSASTAVAATSSTSDCQDTQHSGRASSCAGQRSCSPPRSVRLTNSTACSPSATTAPDQPPTFAQLHQRSTAPPAPRHCESPEPIVTEAP